MNNNAVENIFVWILGLFLLGLIVISLRFLFIEPAHPSNEQVALCVQTCSQHLVKMQAFPGLQSNDGTYTCKCTASYTINKEANNVTPQ